MSRTDITAINAKTISINGSPVAGSAAPAGLVTTFDQLDADAVLALNGTVIQGTLSPGMSFTNFDNINVLSGVSLGDTVKYGTASTPTSGSATGPIYPFPGSGVMPASYPLDNIGGSPPAFAFSTRKLSSTYNGPAIRVIRPSDGATRDIGFIGATLDTAALDSFRGTELLRVLTIYDQSGNGSHVTQSSSSIQAQIGAVSIGGHRALLRIVAHYPLPAALITQKQSLHFFSIQEWNSSQDTSGVVQYGASPDQLSIFQQLSDQVQANGANVNLTDRNQTRPILIEMASSAAGVYLGSDFASATGAPVNDAAMVGGFLGNTALAGGYSAKDYQTVCIGYARRLSDLEAALARQVLRDVFSMSQVAPTKRVIFEGDSITIATNNADRYGYAKMAQRMLPNAVAIYNYALGGSQLSPNVQDRYASTVGATLAAYPANSCIVSLAIGTNDLTIGGRTASQIYADIQAYAAQVRSNGGKIVVHTILPNAAWNSAQQTTRNNLNTMIRNNWASFADAFADHGADPVMGVQSAASNNALYPDGLHPSTLGHSYIFSKTVTAINSIL